MKSELTLKTFLLTNSEDNAVYNNKTRIQAYDIMRGLAVILMILIHVVHIYAKAYDENTTIGYIVEFLGGPPAAPTFMMLMGIFFIYSNKGSTKKSILRGLNLLMIAFALNLVRGIIPYYILTELRSIPAEALGEYFTLEYLIFEIDILTFAGLAYILMAIIYYFFKKPAIWLAIALVIAVGSPLVWRIEVTKLPLQYITNAFWGDEYLSTFPVFPWLSFPLIGMIIGKLLLVSQNQNAVINKLGLYSIVFIAAGGGLILLNTDYFYNAYGRMGIGAIIAIIGFVLFWQWGISKIFYMVGEKIQTGLFPFLSRYVLQVYIVHWVICKWGTIIFGIKSMTFTGVIIMFFSILVLTILITWLYVQLDT